ncbi:MAG TPA: hypothetical protein VF599_06960 [Pyrinomonadaceae bacterium]|jgi:hypothetical protein
MKNNRIIWGIVALTVLITVAATLGTLDSHSQQNSIGQSQPTPTPESPFGDLSKYPIADYDAQLPENAAEREERIIKNKRYDVSLPVAKNPPPDITAIGGYDVEPLCPAIPFAESRLIVIGEIINSKALLSNEKKGIYSEYSVRIQTILKDDKRKKWKAGETITVDRAGGLVRYPSGQKVLYFIEWQALPKVSGRYVFFLSNDDDQNPNYKMLTAYELKNDKVTALDHHDDFREFNGMSETDFIKLVSSKNNRR